MTPETAAARLSIALRPGASVSGPHGNHRAVTALAVYVKFSREVAAEAGPAVLADIVHTVERSAVLTGRAA